MGATFAILFTFLLALFLIRTANNRSLPVEGENDNYLSELQQHGNLHYTLGAYNRDAPLKLFSNDSSGTKKRLALIGDSYSQDLLNIITEGSYLTNYEIRPYYVHFGCQIYMGPEDRQKFIIPMDKQKCRNANDIKYALPIIRPADVVVLAALWLPWSAERLPTTIKSLNLTKEQKLIILGSKHFGRVQPLAYVNASKEYRVTQYHYPAKFAVDANNMLERTIDPSVFVNVMNLLCTGPNSTCPLFTKDGKLISYDGTHVTRYGALYVGELIFSTGPLSQL